jgi:crotonobetainyl-CoA:carnitine CoA-transferase CaiB-like acyl-CoA transferase
MIEEVEHAVLGSMKVLGTPIKLSDTASSIRAAPPTLGQHTEAVLGDLGLSKIEIAGLRSRNVI